jgi:hypothetical protein
VTGADIVRAHADAANGVTFEIREVAPGKLNVQGTAPSPLVLSAFLRALADDPRVGEVAMGKVTAKEAHVAFEILVTMQPTSGLVDRLVLPLLPPTSKLRSITRRDFDGPMPQYAAHIQMPLESTLGSDPSLRLVEVDVARNGDGSDQLWVFDLARIATIHVAGNTTLSQVEILSRLPIVPGDVFDDATLERVRWPSWQQGLFDAVSVTTGPALADGVALIVEVHESKAASRLPLPEAPAIVVRADEGTEVRTARSPQWAPVAAGAALETGDRVRTDGGYAIVQHPRGRTRIQLGPGELVEIDRGGFQSIRVSGDGARPGDEPTALDPLNDVEIAWHLTQEPLRKAIQIINGLANVDVDVDPSLDVDRLVDWNTPTIPLTEALDVLARGSGLEVRIVGPRRIAIASAAAAGGDSFLAKFCIAEVRPDELLRRAGLPGQWAPAVGTRVTMTSGADALVAELEASGALQVISRPLVMVRRGETAEIESGEEGAERLKLTFVVDGSEDPRVLDGTITWAGKPAKFQVPADASTSAVFLGARERGRHLVAIVTVYRQR